MLSVFTWEVQFRAQLSHPLSRSQPSVQLAVALSRPVEYAIEMQTAQFKVGTNLVLVFFFDIKALQDLAISTREFAKKLSHPLRFLRLQNTVQLAGSRLRDQFDRLGIGKLLRPAGTPVMIRRQVPRKAANKTGELFRLAPFSVPDFFESELKCFVGKILGQGMSAGSANQDDRHAPAILLHQLALGRLLPGQDACHQLAGLRCFHHASVKSTSILPAA